MSLKLKELLEVKENKKILEDFGNAVLNGTSIKPHEAGEECEPAFNNSLYLLIIKLLFLR